MSWLARFYNSTIGMKVVMALTGIILYGFVVVHMVGNLQAYLGPEEFNAYSALLHRFTEVLWGARAVLLTSVLLHIFSFVRLRAISAKARPIAYQRQSFSAATVASRFMMLSGGVLLVFIVFHLLHLTAGVVHPDFKMQTGLEGGGHAPLAYHNLTTGMAMWGGGAAIFYVVAQLCLGLHLHHGAVSLFRTLGLQGERQSALVRNLARGLTAVVIVGFISIPIAVLIGIIK